MSRESLIMLFGFLTALSPFAGLPYSWLQIIIPLFALVIIGTAYLMRSERRAPRTQASYDSVEA